MLRRKFECCLSADEKSKLENSKRIDADLQIQKKRYFATQKIVLIGAAESGKTTFLKQMQIIHGHGFSYEEKLMFRTQIYENILKGIAGLINGRHELKLSWRGSFIHNNNVEQKDISGKMHLKVQQFSSFYKHFIDERYNDAKKSRKYIHIMPNEFHKCVNLIIEIWNDDSIRETFDRRRELPKYFVENIPYYIENLDRICRQDYIPDSADILRCRRATTGIVEIEIDIKNVPFRFVDVGGQRTQRQKWHQCFSDVTAILFLASSAEFDECLREDSQTNRLEESCKVFETLINYKYLKYVEFIVFFNKYDLLRDKVKKINIGDYFADFNGNSRSISDVETYLIQKFSNLMHSNSNSSSSTSSSTSSSASSNDNDANDDTIYANSININVNNHQDSAVRSSNNLSSQNPSSASISSQVNLKLIKNHDKCIYSHFTTAIDTNNIKTIFEMVRLMIFEKNCKAVLLN